MPESQWHSQGWSFVRAPGGHLRFWIQDSTMTAIRIAWAQPSIARPCSARVSPGLAMPLLKIKLVKC